MKYHRYQTYNGQTPASIVILTVLVYFVAILVDSEIKKAFTTFTTYSDRGNGSLTEIEKLNLLKVYAPTVNKTDAEIEEFYDQMHTVLRPR